MLGHGFAHALTSKDFVDEGFCFPWSKTIYLPFQNPQKSVSKQETTHTDTLVHLTYLKK